MSTGSPRQERDAVSVVGDDVWSATMHGRERERDFNNPWISRVLGFDLKVRVRADNVL